MLQGALSGIGRALAQMRGRRPVSAPEPVGQSEDPEALVQGLLSLIGVPVAQQPPIVNDPGVVSTPPAVVQSAGANQPAATGFTPTRSKESDAMLAFVNSQIAELQKPRANASPKVEPIEQLLEAFAVSQGLPAFGAAFGLAKGRAAGVQAQNEAGLERAKIGLQYGTSALNALLDRDAALDNVQGAIVRAEMAGKVKQALQASKNSDDLFKFILKADPEGKVNEFVLAQFYQKVQRLPEEAAMEAARAHIANWTPGESLRLQQEKVANAAAGQMEATIRKMMDQASGSGEVSTEATFKAKVGLRELYLKEPQRYPHLAIYNQLDSVLMDESERLSEKGRLAKLSADLKETEGKIKKELLKALPQEIADKHSRIWAQIDHWKEQERVADLSLQEKVSNNARNARLKLYTQSLSAVGRDLGNVTNDITSLVSSAKSASEQLQKIYADPLLYGALKNADGETLKNPDGSIKKGPKTAEARAMVQRLTGVIADSDSKLNGEGGLRAQKQKLLELSSKTRERMEEDGIDLTPTEKPESNKDGGERSEGEKRVFNPKTGKVETIPPKGSASRAGTRGGRTNALRERNRAIGQEKAATYGWTDSEWEALDDLMMKESGWNHNAQNPTSTAYGIGQFLNSTWKGVGIKKTSDPTLQIDAMLKYIRNRYGSPSEALRFHRAKNWY